VGTKKLNLYGCSEVTGDIEQLQLPAGMKELNLGSCYDLTGKARLSERHCYDLTGKARLSERHASFHLGESQGESHPTVVFFLLHN
jgi:hypothetical protein